MSHRFRVQRTIVASADTPRTPPGPPHGKRMACSSMSHECAVLLIYTTLHLVEWLDVPEWGEWCPRKICDKPPCSDCLPPGGFTYGGEGPACALRRRRGSQSTSSIISRCLDRVERSLPRKSLILVFFWYSAVDFRHFSDSA